MHKYFVLCQPSKHSEAKTYLPVIAKDQKQAVKEHMQLVHIKMTNENVLLRVTIESVLPSPEVQVQAPQKMKKMRSSTE